MRVAPVFMAAHSLCGACPVVLDGQFTRACLILAVMCDGLQFCTPGMLIAARDILQRLPGADAETVRHQLSGQICRRTGYTGTVKAIVAAGQELTAVMPKRANERTSNPS
jgi:aerobic carbon-monoxide dehydrogenase small subunit